MPSGGICRLSRSSFWQYGLAQARGEDGRDPHARLGSLRFAHWLDQAAVNAERHPSAEAYSAIIACSSAIILSVSNGLPKNRLSAGNSFSETWRWPDTITILMGGQ
jgi:hypothetical protein